MATRTTSRKKQIAALSGILVLAAGVGATSILGAGTGNISTPLPTHSQVILDDLITVEAGSYLYFEFTIPSEASGKGIVTGTFSSTGSEADDSDVVLTIIPEASLASIKEEKGFEAYYFSGKTSSGDVEAKIPGAGTFYITFDNRFSSSSDKAVDARLELAY